MMVLLSIKPEFARLILKGGKKYEFRRKVFSRDVKKAVIYASAPVKKVVGFFDIDKVLTGTIPAVWHHTAADSGIDKAFYDRYFHGGGIANAVKIGKVHEFHPYLPLDYLGIKKPPQNFMYLDEIHEDLLKAPVSMAN